MDCYLYRHIRSDTNQVFYVGIAQKKHESDYSRAKAANGNSRSAYWKRITTKSLWKSEVLLDNLTWLEACEKEKEFIKLYGRANLGLGTLCNLTDGGDGRLGYKATEEFRGKISKSRVGFKHSEEAKAIIGLKSLGKRHSDVTKQKLSTQRKGIRRRIIEKIIFNSETGIFYSGLIEAAESVNMTKYTIGDRLRNKLPNDTSLKYV